MTPVELHAQMDRLRVSTTRLAAEMGVTTRAVRMWKSGHRRVPEEALLRALDRIVARRDGYRQGRVDAAAAIQRAILEMH